MASLCSGFLLQDITHLAKTKSRTMMITMICRCPTITTGTMRVTKAVTTPSHHWAAFGIVRPGMEKKMLIEGMMVICWRCVWDSKDRASPKICWNKGGQTDGSSSREEVYQPFHPALGLFSPHRSMQKGGWMDHPYLCLSPVFTIGVVVAFKLYNIWMKRFPPTMLFPKHLYFEMLVN